MIPPPPPQNIPVTLVRYDAHQGYRAIEAYIFGGMLGSPRVPRGVDPEIIPRVIREKLKMDSPPDAYGRALEAIRFYERVDAVPHMMLALTGKEAGADDVLRSTYILQAAGDFGSVEVATRAAQYFDAKLVSNPSMLDVLPQMLEVLVALATVASPSRLALRLRDEISKAEPARNVSEEGMRNYERLASYQRNDFRKAVNVMEDKKRLAGLQTDFRRPELVQMYLGQSGSSTWQMQIWCARMLRAEAMMGHSDPVWHEFARVIDALPSLKLGETESDLVIARAAQAIIYLQGKLSADQKTKYEKARKFAGMNFLWDDLA